MTFMRDADIVCADRWENVYYIGLLNNVRDLSGKVAKFYRRTMIEK